MLFALGKTNLPRGIPSDLSLLRIPDNFVSTVEIQSLQNPIHLWESSSLSKSNPPSNCVNPPISIVLVLKPNQNQIIFKHTAVFSNHVSFKSTQKQKTKSRFTTNFSWLQNLLLEILTLGWESGFLRWLQAKGGVFPCKKNVNPKTEYRRLVPNHARGRRSLLSATKSDGLCLV